MFDISRSRGIPLAKLRAANPGVDPRKLRVGQRIQLPGTRDSFEAAPRTAARRPASPVAQPRARNTTLTGPQATATRTAQRIPWRNGRIPSSALTSVGGGHKLYGDAARQFIKMRDAARRDGISLRLTDSYRSYDAQVDLARRKGLYGQRLPNGRLGLAARPGTSNHGLGRAVDVNVNDARVHQWLVRHAATYGYHTIPREPWHWEFRN